MSQSTVTISLLRAGLVTLLGFLASGILGLIRTAVFASTFGAGEQLDAFNAAQRIPETLYVLVAGGALSSSFIPIFSRFIVAGDGERAWRLASTVLTNVLLVAAGIAVIAVAVAPLIVPPLLEAGATPEQQTLTIQLTQAMMITIALFSVSGLLMGILNTSGNFTLPALALSMNNLGQIFGAIFLSRYFGIYGLAYGVVIGAALHLLVQLPGLHGIGARLRFLPRRDTEGAGEVLRLMLPRILGLGVVQINFIVNTNLTSGMVSGSRTVFVVAWTLTFFVLGVIAQSVGTAVFPALAAAAGANDMATLKARFTGAMRSVFFLAIPATVVIVILGLPGITLLLERGAWTAIDTRATWQALCGFAVGIVGHSALEVLSRTFYALSDTRTPVLIGIGSILLNIVLSLILIRVIGSPDSLEFGAFIGLALANSIATLLEAIILWILLRRRLGDLGDRAILFGAARAALAAAAMGTALLAIVTLFPSAPLLQLVIGGGVGAAVFFGAAFLLRMEEARTIPRLILRRIRP